MNIKKTLYKYYPYLAPKKSEPEEVMQKFCTLCGAEMKVQTFYIYNPQTGEKIPNELWAVCPYRNKNIGGEYSHSLFSWRGDKWKAEPWYKKV